MDIYNSEIGMFFAKIERSSSLFMVIRIQKEGLMTHILKRYAVAVILFWFIVFQIGVWGAAAQQTSAPVTLKVVRLPFLSYGPIFIAEEEGFFTEQGIQVEFLKMKEAMALQALALGSIDVWAGIFTVGSLNAMVRGGDIRLVADKGHFAPAGCPSFGLIARKSLAETGKLGDLQLLKGRKFDVFLGSFEEYFLDKILSRAGIKPGEIEKFNVPPPAQMDALAKGRLDFGVTSEPFVTRYKRSGHGVLWTSVQQVIPDFNYAFVRFGPSLLKKNPEAGKRFMVAYLRGIRQYRQGKTDRNLAIMSKHTHLDKSILKEACWPQVSSNGEIKPQSLLDFQDWAMAKGLQDRKMAVEKMWEPAFVDYANQILKSGP
jgi:NitT/TauT family transport system substrate-binding protein